MTSAWELVPHGGVPASGRELFCLDTRKEGHILKQEMLPAGDLRLRPVNLPAAVALALLVGRAAALGWEWLQVKKIYTYNERSRRLYEGAGFTLSGTGVDEAGRAYWQLERRLKP